MPQTPKISLTQNDLLQHLDEQIGFLESSADAYDRGFDGEAKRLAASLRILLHDTQSSHSLLSQLDRKSITFISTSMEFNPNNLLTHGGLVAMAIGGSSGGKFLALLDDVPFMRPLSFEEWWSEPIFVDSQRRTLTRKKVILTAADQDGGAHVDPSLDGIYADLSRNNSLNWVISDGTTTRPMPSPVRACIRQIAHEVLKTIKPDYSKQPNLGDVGAVAMNMNFAEEPTAIENHIPIAAPNFEKIGRNAPCPCGSGNKYKKCHGKII